LFLCLAAVLVAAASGSAWAQNFPTRPIKIIVGFPPGSATDTPARILAAELTTRLGQSVIVENRVGANGLIAAQTVKNAPPDGYTILYGSVVGFSPSFMKYNPISAAKELQGISSGVYSDWFLYVPTSLGVSNLKELTAYARNHPGQFRFAAYSQSTTLVMATMARRLGFEFDNIPYKSGNVAAIQGLLNGEVQATLDNAPSYEGFVKDGKMRPITVLAKERSLIYPNAIPAAEQGVPFDLRVIHSVWTTLGTPRDVVNKLSAAIREALQSPATVGKLKNMGMIPGGSTPEELVRLTEAEAKFYVEAAALIGFQAQ
jgi:tripartite-type tricarboxylate transporter receptor subunit TctC